ncbi:hypothetical protein [Microcoleus sp. FACHB-831]|nr:hypothetical protein [Microcoleus sp. FACHB-831]
MMEVLSVLDVAPLKYSNSFINLTMLQGKAIAQLRRLMEPPSW